MRHQDDPDAPPKASPLEILGAWLRIWTPPRDVVAVRADHPLALSEMPFAEVGTVAIAEVAAAPTMPHVP